MQAPGCFAQTAAKAAGKKPHKSPFINISKHNEDARGRGPSTAIQIVDKKN